MTPSDALERIEHQLEIIRDAGNEYCAAHAQQGLAAVAELRLAYEPAEMDRLRKLLAEQGAEVVQLRAQLHEALDALRKINMWDQQEHTCEADEGPCLPCRIGEKARAVLAKLEAK